MGPDTYTVTFGGGIGLPNHVGTGPARARVLKAANEFCQAKGLVMVPISIREQQGVMGQHTAQVELDFRALQPGDPEINRPNLQAVLPIQRMEIKTSTNPPASR